MNPTEIIAARQRKNAEETRRATSRSDPELKYVNLSGLEGLSWVIRCDGGFTEILENVIVQSATGTGGRAYAANGSSVLIRRNAGGRWLCVGPADRTVSTGETQYFDEAAESAGAAVPDVGFTSFRAPFEYFADNLVWNDGVTPFNLIITQNAAGEEV